MIGSPEARVRWVIAALTAGSVPLLIAGARLDGPALPSATVVGGSFALLILAEVLVVKVYARGDTMALTLFEAVLAPVLVVTPVPLAVLGAAGAQAIAGRIHRLPLRKLTFNVAQWTFAAAAGGIVVTGLGTGSTGSALGAVAVAMLVMAAVNTCAFATVLRVSQGTSLREIARRLGRSIAVGWAVNAAFAALFITALAAGPSSLAAAAIPLFALHWASRGHAAAAADAARLRGMHDALAALTTSAGDALAPFLAAIREAFDAACAEIVLADPDGPRSMRDCARLGPGEAPATGIARAILATQGTVRLDPTHSSALADELRSAGFVSCLAAPIRLNGSVIGSLCVYDRAGHAGFEDGERAILEALASEAAGAIARADLMAHLAREHHALANVIDGTTDGIFAIDAGGFVRLWNPAMATITGFHTDEVLGRRFPERLRPRDANGDPVSLGDRDGAAPAQFEITSRAGTKKWLACSWSPRTDEGGGMVVIARDATREREIDRLKEDFIATVSHELRTPLTPIKGWAQTLVAAGDRMSGEERHAAAGAILRQASGLEDLVTNLLEAAQIERGVISVRDDDLALAPIVAESVHQGRTVRPERTIRVDGDLDGLCVRGDAVWVGRILNNLVQNALKYSPDGSPVTIRAAMRNSAVVIEVEDLGPGIDPRDHDRIFERFTRLGDYLTRSQAGTGLGLYISRRLARALGGDVTVDSSPGAGSRFSLSLPAVTPAVTPVRHAV